MNDKRVYERLKHLAWWRRPETELSGWMVGLMFRYFPGVDLYTDDDDLEDSMDKIGWRDWDFFCEQVWAMRKGYAEIPYWEKP